MHGNINDLIGQTDIVFVLDTTSSMQPFIAAAKEHISRIANKAVTEGDLSLRMAIVEYRDHPPQEESFITKIHQFEENLASFQAVLDTIDVRGGGDEAEAVYDGLIQATKLDWRAHASKNIWLVGDSPPHGSPNLRLGASMYWMQGCPCGDTEQTCLKALKDRKITLNAITLTEKADLKEAFQNLALGTNGEFSHRPNQPQQAVAWDLDSYFTRTVGITHTNRDYYTVYTTAVAAGTSTKPEVLATMSGMSVADATASHEDLASRNIIIEEDIEDE